MELAKAPDVQKLIQRLITELKLSHISANQVICFRSYGATSRARARIWSFPRIWQMALELKPHYVIEVLSEHYDRLPYEERLKVLIHELLHIPKTFSGSLVPHRNRGRKIDRRNVEQLFNQLKEIKKAKL